MQIGERLRAVRQQQGLSLRAMARALGVSNWQVQVVERGKTNDPSLGYVWRCAQVYGVSFSTLLAEVECPTPRPRRQAAAEKMRAMPSET